MGGNPCDLEFGKDFLDMTPKACFIKGQIDKWDFNKSKNLLFKGNSLVVQWLGFGAFTARGAWCG